MWRVSLSHGAVSRSGGPSEPTSRGGGMARWLRGVGDERVFRTQGGMGARGKVRLFARVLVGALATIVFF